MADEERTKRTRSPKQQLLLLAIPGALPWLTVALYEWTDWVSCERGEMLVDLLYIQAVFAVGASIATFTVKGQPVLHCSRPGRRELLLGLLCSVAHTVSPRGRRDHRRFP